MNTVKVRALSQGFDGFQRRRPGEVFAMREDLVFVDGKFRSNWLELVDDKPVPEVKRARKATERAPDPGLPKASNPKAHVPPDELSGEASGADGGGSGNADVI